MSRASSADSKSGQVARAAGGPSRQSTADGGTSISLPYEGDHVAYFRPPALPFPLQHGAFGPSVATSSGLQEPPQPGPIQAPSKAGEARLPTQQSLPSTLSVSTPTAPDTASGKRIPCSFYLKTGNCAFGTECKFEHPLDQPVTQYNSLGLPLRPGEPDCAYYVRNLHCGYGASCKFNHNEPYYSWVPVQMMDRGIHLQPMGMPMAMHSPASNAQASVMLQPAPAIEAMVHSQLSQPQPQLQMPQLHPLAPTTALPGSFRPGMPQGSFIPQPRLAAPSNPTLLHPLATPMLQPVGAHHMLPPMAAAGVPAGLYPGFSPALIGGAPMLPTMPGSSMFPTPQPVRSEGLRISTASQSAELGNSRSQEGRAARRSRSSRSGDSQGGRWQGNQDKGHSARKPIPQDGYKQEKQPDGVVASPQSGSGSSNSLAGGFSSLSLAPAKGSGSREQSSGNLHTTESRRTAAAPRD